MPTYAYRCRDCGHDLEAVQKFTDDPLTVCPNCGGSLRKLFSPVGVVFKGSGFYRNDSRKSGNGQSGNGQSGKQKSENAKSAGSDGSAEKKSGGSDKSGAGNGDAGSAKSGANTGTATS